MESFWGVKDEALARTLLAPERADLARDARRFAAGLAFSSLFGLALGLRFGVVSMAAHAAGVPVAFLVVALLATPAFFVGLLHGGFEIDARVLASAIARGAATSGLVLAGLSPAVALYSLSAEDATSVALLAAVGLALAGLLGQRATFRSLPEVAGLRGARFLLFRAAFGSFAAVLAARIWWLVLPVFGGQS
jgi:hypothetical protein